MKQAAPASPHKRKSNRQCSKRAHPPPSLLPLNVVSHVVFIQEHAARALVAARLPAAWARVEALAASQHAQWEARAALAMEEAVTRAYDMRVTMRLGLAYEAERGERLHIARSARKGDPFVCSRRKGNQRSLAQ